jgi:D-glycero-D-manno-heptose 1,7-bisphosphate phosphatase
LRPELSAERALTVSPYPLDADGVWSQVLSPMALSGGVSAHRTRAALFLDRDGVIVEEVDYLQRVEDVALIAGAAAAIAAANRSGIPVVLVTNQAGIGRGYYGWAQFTAVQDAILADLAATGATVDAVYACPHHAAGKDGFAHPDHPARKPNTGMLVRAGKDLALDLRRSWLVGDKATDIEAAKRAGLAGAMHVLTGHGESERAAASALATPGFEVRLAESIADAVELPLMAGD